MYSAAARWLRLRQEGHRFEASLSHLVRVFWLALPMMSFLLPANCGAPRGYLHSWSIKYF